MPEFLTADEVAKMLRVSKRRLPDLVRKNAIPKPLVLGYRTHRWRASDFEAHQPKPKKSPLDAILDAKGW